MTHDEYPSAATRRAAREVVSRRRAITRWGVVALVAVAAGATVLTAFALTSVSISEDQTSIDRTDYWSTHQPMSRGTVPPHTHGPAVAPTRTPHAPRPHPTRHTHKRTSAPKP